MRTEMMTTLLNIWRSHPSRGPAGPDSETPAADAALLASASGTPGTEEALAVLPTVSRRYVVECLEHVVDPEVGIDIVALGLVYAIDVDGPRIRVELTMTTPACPMSSHITRYAKGILQRIDGVEDVRIELSWQPRWHPEMIDPEARRRRFGAPAGR